ncbi:F0F1 ATP synthase subunit delta [Prosthecochloris sp. N3]|uniref:ATP synthase subunit delta n=1 Tax=Prosthecochloris ethylica TaxID=2743976 RepID=A0ABR9XUM5_9CHLB|nr:MULTISPECIES: ATP synthase F1 subunit delta [Prosthecochloris]MBF0587201.1 F0F1 ATP synthase subunit delta [Prosthecochloris ethylica]MBF0637679.1 F0F1 ATP synthase subunit delta [Prosthecochloris ethylica]NUK48329.1 F0F1 ATP synthase subunit delta [Prosthecochloris ethylica]RNA65659.1 F0F1 ATP synthase subunit delta [Prosthecochloris sp. ZM_2]
MSSAIASRRYATALLDVAEEVGVTEQVAGDLELIDNTISGSRDLRAMLKSPLIKGDAKSRALKEIFKGKLGEKTLLFLDLVCRKKRADHLPQIVVEFSALRDERAGIVNVDVKSAVKLDEEQARELINALADYTGKKVKARLSLEEQMLGGVSVKIGDTILDGSIRHQLEMLKGSLTGAA